MRLTTKGRFAVTAMIDLAMQHGSGPVTLAKISERQNQVVTLRYFGGMRVHEIAAVLEVSVVTVERDWRMARRWLRKRLSDQIDD